MSGKISFRKMVQVAAIFAAFAFVAAMSSGCSRKVMTTGGFSVTSDGWIVPKRDSDLPVWGAKDGIVVGLYPTRMSFLNRNGGPRGLLRIGYEKGGTLYFVNFIVITPVSKSANHVLAEGSELAKSPTDGKQGIKFYSAPPNYMDAPDKFDLPLPHNTAARVSGSGSSQKLEIGVVTERFPSGAQCFVKIAIRKNKPNELIFQSYLLKGKSNIDSLVLSSTFGNITRLRVAYLVGQKVNAKKLYPKFYGDNFAPLTLWGPHRMRKNHRGDLVFVVGTNESRPWETAPYPHPTKLLQYYRKPKGSWNDEFRALVNARSRYWKSSKEIPNGNSYENLAIVEPFTQGRKFIYGIWPGSVDQLLKGDPYTGIR